MLVDLLATSNFVSYNIKVAELLGLHPAIYISELTNICEKAIRKEKVQNLNNKCYFTIDREYIKSRTTLDIVEQNEIESKLVSLGILEKLENTVDTIYINIEGLAGLIGGSLNNSIVDNINKIANSKNKKVAKNEAIKNSLRSNIKTTNCELLVAYSNWIDAVYSKEGWMSKDAVIQGERVVDSFSNHDLNKALDIVHIASVNGYRDMNWAINAYDKSKINRSNNVPIPNKINGPIKFDEGVF